MLKSVESIKNNSLVAKRIISTDNSVRFTNFSQLLLIWLQLIIAFKALDKLSMEAEKNSENLAIVSNHLTTRVSKSCNCWIWLMILLIMIVFIVMVLFMKIFPKKKYSSPDSMDYSDSSYASNYLNNKSLSSANYTSYEDLWAQILEFF